MVVPVEVGDVSGRPKNGGHDRVEVLGDVQPELLKAFVDGFELEVVSEQGGVQRHCGYAGVREWGVEGAGGGRKK